MNQVTERVVAQLDRDFPHEFVRWAEQLEWFGLQLVPLERIDWTDEQFGDDADHLERAVDHLKTGRIKPVVLVCHGDYWRVLDGHYRALAYRQLGLPILAFLAYLEEDHGEWDEMHDHQREWEAART